MVTGLGRAVGGTSDLVVLWSPGSASLAERIARVVCMAARGHPGRDPEGMLMPVGERSDLEMFSGDDLDLVVTVVDEDEVVLDITTADPIRWRMSRLDSTTNFPSPRGAAVVSKALASGITITSGISGILTIALDDVDTDDLRAGDYYHELEMVLSGARTTVMYGVLTLREDLVE